MVCVVQAHVKRTRGGRKGDFASEAIDQDDEDVGLRDGKRLRSARFIIFFLREINSCII